jgi:hypothetical protein
MKKRGKKEYYYKSRHRGKVMAWRGKSIILIEGY